MKISFIIISSFLLIGCVSSRQSASLTPQQAHTLAMQAANEKAFTLYHCRPFGDGQPAHFVGGHWVWTDQQGFGHGDMEATVELAADGGPQKVDVTLLDNQAIMQ